MKTTILLATLKKEGVSNTQVLSEFLVQKMQEKNIDSEICKLVDYNILPGTYASMGESDEWPKIEQKILSSDVVIFATPIWWGSHSSEMQKVIERLDYMHDMILEGKPSLLDGKIGGIIVTGDSDGAQHVIGNIANFFNAIGLLLPPFSTLTVLWDGQKKGAKTSKDELMKKYEEEYTETADKMINQIIKYADLKH